MLRTEGHLKTYLKSREIAVSKKNLPSNRDMQYDPGPEKVSTFLLLLLLPQPSSSVLTATNWKYHEF
jgi:hypothetical protein